MVFIPSPRRGKKSLRKFKRNGSIPSFNDVSSTELVFEPKLFAEDVSLRLKH